MKVTKHQLLRIIRESMNEYGDRYPEERYDDPNVDPDDHQMEDADPEREELIAALEKEYGLKVKTTEDFDGSPGGVWIAQEAATNPSDGLPLFDYYMENEPYVFGVHEEFEDFLKPYGFFPEWNDPGTLMLWRA